MRCPLLFLFSLVPLIFHAKEDVLFSDETNNSKIANLNVYVDGGTFGLINSLFINVETYVASSKSNKLNVYLRGSYGHVIFFSGGSGTSSFVNNTKTGVGAITLLTGKKNHHFDSSSGIFFRDGSILPFLDLGYRFQKLNGGVIFRGKIGFLGVGLGIGYSF